MKKYDNSVVWVVFGLNVCVGKTLSKYSIYSLSFSTSMIKGIDVEAFRGLAAVGLLMNGYYTTSFIFIFIHYFWILHESRLYIGLCFMFVCFMLLF